MVGVLTSSPQERIANPGEVVGIWSRQDESTAGSEIPPAQLEQSLGAPEMLDELAGNNDIEHSVDRLPSDVADSNIESFSLQCLDAIADDVDAETLRGHPRELAVKVLSAAFEVIHDAQVEQSLAPDYIAQIGGSLRYRCCAGRA
jgi:hypothetical protein